MAVNINKNEILRLAEKYKPEMSRFSRDIIAIPSESCGERSSFKNKRRNGKGRF
jgi:hypothetical protein